MNPIEEILPRTPDDLQEILDKFSDLLNQTVAFGTHILKWDVEKIREGKDNNIPSVFLRNIIELTDSISILIRNSSIDPAKIIFRSLIESSYALIYMLEKDEKQRAKCFIVCRAVEKINQCNKWISTENSHKDFVKKISQDEIDADLTRFYDHPDFLRVKRVRESLLQKPEFKPIYEEYKRTKKNLKKAPKWYSLYDGPQNFIDLTEEINKSLRYEFYYKQFSDNVHGTSLEKGFAYVGNGLAQIIQIRDFENVEELFSHSVSSTVDLYIHYVRKRIPEKEPELNHWYQQFKIPYLNITSKKLIDYKK